ncbi:MAG: hypothetical protein GXP24_12375 [Planctomycetes bacterium]|nr:hypothetical protein [Planctomycetota bacterium]
MSHYSSTRIVLLAMLLCVRAMLFGSIASGQVDRQKYLGAQSLAEVEVQSLKSPQNEAYSNPSAPGMFLAEAEDPLSFYVRTQDGEWQIPAQVNRDDPWVRLLILSPVRPTIVDVAIEINQHSFRAAREQWIDQLLAEAKTAFLVREGEANPEVVETTESSDAIRPTKKNEEIPMVAAQSRMTRTLFKRLVNYLAADPSIVDHEASREELRWLLAEWTGGPALLTLSPALAWRRADAAPLWRAIDRDGDYTLSREEIEQTAATFKQADINRDDIVDLDELQRLGNDRAKHEQTQGHPLVVVLEENTDWKALKKHLNTAYELPVEAVNQLSLPADLVVRISFGNEAKVALLAVNDAADQSWRLHSSTEQVITVARQETYVELSAAQGKDVDPENTRGDMQQTQVAIGAVVDGFPLFRLLDQDNNRQLTSRERRSASGILTNLDRNHNGQVDRSEIPTAIRLAVTHGPKVHEHLAQAISAQRKHRNQVDSPVPDWFIGMDRNHDGDLSKREFQGSPEQFAQYDRDEDGLISRKEAQ